MKTKTSEARAQEVIVLSDGRDELNLAEWPIAFLGKQVPKGQTTLEFQDTQTDPRSGQPVTRRLTVLTSDKYGLPLAADEEVILGLIQLTKLKNNFTDRIVHFSRYELVRLLRWPDSGASYKRLETSLTRWLSVTLDFEKAWWDNRRRGWVDEKFHVLDNLSFFEQREGAPARGGQDDLPFSSFTWNSVIFRSFQDDALKRVDFSFFVSLQTPISRRLYRYLDKHFWKRTEVSFDVCDLGLEHIGLSRNYSAGKIKQKLAPAIAELQERGFLTEHRYERVRHGQWKVHFSKKAIVAAPAEPPVAALTGLAQELVRRGVTESVARELTASQPAERIAAKIELLDWMIETKSGGPLINPAGYLVEAIRNDYAPPAGFETKAQREQKRKAYEAKAKSEAERKRTREEAVDTARQARQRHIGNYLAGMSEKDRIAFEERAFANADPMTRRHAAGKGPLADAARNMIIDNEVLRVHPLPVSR